MLHLSMMNCIELCLYINNITLTTLWLVAVIFNSKSIGSKFWWLETSSF